MSALARPGDRAVRPARLNLLARLLRGRGEDRPWLRPAYLAVTLLAAILYFAGLTQSGYANPYYSAAVVAASKSWSAFFFGSLDAGNFITVDKPAGALWLMDLSVRIFGVHSWSILLPEALAGVLSVALLFHVVRRSFGPLAGLMAALILALTPVAVVMFRFNNPEAVLTLLLIAAAWALLRSLDTGRLRWLLLSAFLVGLGFNTKYLQAYLVLPALIVTFFLAATGSWRRRLLQLLAAAGVLLVSSGWWLVIMDLIPASARPYIGGSTNNSVLDLVLGYDGFGRIFGIGVPGPRGGGGGGASFGGAAGWLRLFNDQVGGEISWLLPFALVALAVGLFRRRRGSRTDRRLAGYTLWGLWLLVGALVFSFSSGIFHEYYTIQIAPAIAALGGTGIVELWSWRRESWVASLVLGFAFIGTALWAERLLGRTPTFVPWLGPIALTAAVLAGVMVVLLSLSHLRPAPTRVAWLVGALGFLAILAGPTAYSLYTVGHAAGGLPSAGPISAKPLAYGFADGALRAGQTPPAAVLEEVFGGQRSPNGGPPPGQSQPRAGGAFGMNSVDSALTKYLVDHQGSATWIVAVSGAGEAASIELATGKPVMAMGGFLGSDPVPTLDQLEALVHLGKLRYVLVMGGGFVGPTGSNGNAQTISSWVTQHGQAVSGVGNGNLYDLAGAA